MTTDGARRCIEAGEHFHATRHARSECPTSGVRIALTNEYGGIDRVFDATPDVVWEYAYHVLHREMFPHTRDAVQVRMGDGSWRRGMIVTPA